jgi:hypothetical protein
LDQLSDDNIGVLARSDGTAFTVGNITSHLHGCQPLVVVAFSGSKGDLSREYLHEARDGSEIRGDGDGLVRGN